MSMSIGSLSYSTGTGTDPVTTTTTTTSTSSSKETHNDGNSEDVTGVAVGSAIGGLIGLCCLVAIILGIVYFFAQRRKKKGPKDKEVELEKRDSTSSGKPENSKGYINTHVFEQPTNKIEPNSENARYSGLNPPSQDEQASRYTTIPETSTKSAPKFMINPDDLEYGPVIGTGAYGVVYKGTWRKAPVAIKQTKISSLKQIEEFTREAEVMVNLPPHENVILLKGICLNPCLIVTEFADRGSLDSFLQSDAPIDEELRKKFIMGIQRGVIHLHHEGVVHRDLAARNILLRKDLEPKISDFGMSRFCEVENRNTTKNDVGPICWMAPESIKSQVYSAKSDIFSLGIVWIEIYTRKEPYHDSGLTIFQVGEGIVNKRFGPPIPKEAPEEIQKIMRKMFEHEPEKRPKADRIYEELEDLSTF